jgi:uncharacterized membrane protein
MQQRTQQITLIALFLALCVVVPILFHVVGAGAMFLPMFVPIILAGFLINFPQAILVGLLGPWLSAFLTGMPPLFPTALIMTVEGATAAGIVSYFYHKKEWSFWVCLIISVIAERIALVIMGFIIAPLFDLPGELFSIYKLIESLPGVFLQLILIPIILKILWKFDVNKGNTRKN